VRLEGNGGPVVQGQPATTQFHGTLKLKQVGIAGLAKFLNSPAFAKTDGIVSGDTRIDSDSGKMTANGQMNIQNPRVHGIDLGFPVTAQYDLTDDPRLMQSPFATSLSSWGSRRWPSAAW